MLRAEHLGGTGRGKLQGLALGVPAGVLVRVPWDPGKVGKGMGCLCTGPERRAR